MSAGRSTATGTANPAADAGGGVGDLPFETALAQLEEIVRQLEKGDVPLDKSVEIYERGEVLKRHCEALLKRAEARIQKITLGPNGEAVGTVPLDVD